MIKKHVDPQENFAIVRSKFIQKFKKDLNLPKHGGSLKGRVAIITGANRGIGNAIAIELAKEGVNIVIAAKTVESKEKTMETIYDAQKQIEAYGVKALPVKCDVRNESEIINVVD